MAEQARIVIVGGGVAGVATAWWLGVRGEEGIVVLEREKQLGTQSSGLNAGIMRTTDPDPEVVELAERSAIFLHTPPPGFADHPLIDPVGLLLCADDAGAAALEKMVGNSGEIAPHEPVSRERLRELAPFYAGEPAVAFRFPGQGHLDVAALMEGYARGAHRAGVEFRSGIGVARILVEDGAAVGVVLADGEEVRAETVVLAAGGWAARLGQAAGSRVALKPTRRHLMVSAPDPAIDTRWPVLWQSNDGGFYCKPESGGMMISACDQVAVDPDDCPPDPEVLVTIAEKTARWIPSLGDAGAAHFWCGMRTMTADDRFAIGFDPDVKGLFWVAGLGGHGMVCSAEVGRLASALLIGEAGDDSLVPGLDPARLTSPTAG